MNHLEHAFQLNNEGVSLLLEANDRAACKRFGESLAELQNALQEDETIDSNTRDTSSIAIHNNINGRESVVYGKPVMVPNLQDEQYFLYKNAIKFDVDALSSQQQPKQNEIHIFIATVILNSALGYHRQVTLGRKQLIRKTKELYDYIAELILEGESLSNPLHDQELAFAVLLGATNNHSVLHQLEGEYDLSNKGFQQLAFLLGTKNKYNSNILHVTVSNDTVTGMNLNIVVTTSLHPSAAGAA